jgi:hypothetical protein
MLFCRLSHEVLILSLSKDRGLHIRSASTSPFDRLRVRSIGNVATGAKQ